MWAKLKEFFKEIGIILTMIADGSMDDYIDNEPDDNFDFKSDDSEPDIGPM